MKRTKPTIHLVGLSALIAMLSVTGCKPSSPASGGGGKLFGVSFQTMNNPFFVDLNKGLKAVIEAKGDRLVTLDAQFNSLKQKNDVADLLQQQPAAIFINPVNWEGIKGTLIEAKRKNVPVIIVDAPVSDPDLVLCQVASDNVEAGRLACEALAKVKPEAKVVILHLSVNKACIDRVAGFKAEMAKHPGMKILDTQEGKGAAETARPVMRDLLGRFPELDAAFPINDPSAIGHHLGHRGGGPRGAGHGGDGGRLARRRGGDPGRQAALDLGAVPARDRAHRGGKGLRASGRKTGGTRTSSCR